MNDALINSYTYGIKELYMYNVRMGCGMILRGDI